MLLSLPQPHFLTPGCGGKAGRCDIWVDLNRSRSTLGPHSTWLHCSERRPFSGRVRKLATVFTWHIGTCVWIMIYASLFMGTKCDKMWHLTKSNNEVSVQSLNENLFLRTCVGQGALQVAIKSDGHSSCCAVAALR